MFKPESTDAVKEAIAWAAAEEKPLEVRGRGSKAPIGRPVQAEYTLDLSALTGVTLYEPEELVLSARAGTPLAEIEALLADNNQQLDFEPMDYGLIHATGVGDGTIGGVLAANLSGPRRLKAGAARDHILGVAAVSGRGEMFKSGGRVVKNVTGYDLSKGLAGSWGTLAAITDVTFKVLPRAETAATVLVTGLDDRRAADVMCTAMGSSCEVSGAAHLPADAAGRLSELAGASGAVTALRLEGFGPSVAYRKDALKSVIAGAGGFDELGAEDSRTLWRAIRDAAPLAEGAAPLWRVSVAPTAGPVVIAALVALSFRHFYDWSGGLIWLAVDNDVDDAGADLIRAAVAASGGGHATLVRGSAALRAAVPPFQPQEPALAALSKRLKENFDPNGILNPGRMVAGV
ncbi:MAG TPA: glycolate oxidase subunit GlcE [Afifellaceae bacterium]|nr:glycolate oxidase subunit GlcE [Afifellaceae bacterium]